MSVKIIRSEAEYEDSLGKFEALMELDPEPGTPEADQLELLSFLIEQYEEEHFPFEMPDPITAILFRMEQQGLAPRDLVRYIGSRSKVSEVLSGKRPLSLTMIKALHAGLGIPAQVLIAGGDDASKEQGAPDNSDKPEKDDDSAEVPWSAFPIRDMLKRGYFSDQTETLEITVGELQTKGKELILNFLHDFGGTNVSAIPVLCHKTLTTRAARSMNEYALAAWTVRVLRQAKDNPPPIAFDRDSLTEGFFADVARLSLFENGPILAQELLHKQGISLIVEPHLPKTHLDGAAIAYWGEHPVIGLTIRHDRLDNFWFCLLHELAHIKLHFWDSDGKFIGGEFYDDVESETQDSREKEADELAGEALVPLSELKKDPVLIVPSPQAAERLANRLRVHPSVVAGRVRHYKNSYRLLNSHVGQGEVRKLFPKVSWVNG